MRFIESIIMLMVLFVGIVLSQQDTCWKYGNCDPGPECEDWDNGLDNDKCFNCCDDIGFITKDKLCNGKQDCRTGTDENPFYCFAFGMNLRRSQRELCFAPKQDCSVDKECCSEICRNGSCWDENCGQN